MAGAKTVGMGERIIEFHNAPVVSSWVINPKSSFVSMDISEISRCSEIYKK